MKDSAFLSLAEIMHKVLFSVSLSFAVPLSPDLYNVKITISFSRRKTFGSFGLVQV